MSVFDLKPLTNETIQDLKIDSDQLWEIKIDENIYGPFDTHQLRHYSKENKEGLLRAFVSPMSVDNWRPFFEVREFVHDGDYNGPYWLLINGRKSSPLSVDEIAKRIELGTIKRQDELSEDEGRNWHRISAHPEFEAYFTTGSSLPSLPVESSFQKSKQKVLEQLEAKTTWSEEKDNIASLTHMSLVRKEKTRTVQIENIKMPAVNVTSGAPGVNYKRHLYWAVPVLAVGVYFFSGTSTPKREVAVDSAEVKKAEPLQKKTVSRKDNWSRSPANDRNSYNYQRSPVTQTPPGGDDYYPTVIETHQEDQNYPDPMAESDQVAEIQDQEERNEDQALIQRPEREPAQDGGESLDATMNNEPQERPDPAIDVPIVEEVSDF